MSTAIRDVSETLIDLLRSRVTGIGTESIALVSPADAMGVGGVQLGLSLYSVMPTADFRNQSEIFGDPDLQEPPSPSLDLYYLLTVYPAGGDDRSGNNFDAQHLLGLAMRAFFDNGTLTGSVLRGNLPRDQELRLTFQPMTLEDLTRIFDVFPDNALQTSVSYVVSPVKLLPERGIVAPQRVVARDMQIDQAIPVPQED
jgi:Pvc16 N-terminal domain